MENATLPRPPRNRWTTRALAIALTCAVLSTPIILTTSAIAQEATPAPVACDVEPRPVTFLADILAAPKPEVTPTPVAGIPEGTDVTDPVVRAEIEKVVQTLIICVNQGEILRAFSLYDDEFVRRLIDPDGIMGSEIAIEVGKSLAKTVPADAEDVTTLDEIILVRALPDGTVAVVFRTHGGPDREQDDSQIDLFVLRNVDTRWLIIDGLTDLDPQSLPTPSA
jgi:hypothetical protein